MIRLERLSLLSRRSPSTGAQQRLARQPSRTGPQSDIRPIRTPAVIPQNTKALAHQPGARVPCPRRFLQLLVLFRKPQPGHTHGIQMDIASHFQPLAVAPHQHRAKAPLKQVPAALMPAIEPHAIGHVEPLPCLAQVGLGRFQQQMEMIVHENPPVQTGPKPLRQLAQKLEEMQTVPVVAEDGPALVAARRHMIPSSGTLNPQWTSHAGRMGIPRQMSIMKMCPQVLWLAQAVHGQAKCATAQQHNSIGLDAVTAECIKALWSRRASAIHTPCIACCGRTRAGIACIRACMRA